jgi:acetyl-CoA/propionyl-CoA carboxylase carboxyl transferase subunit
MTETLIAAGPRGLPPDREADPRNPLPRLRRLLDPGSVDPAPADRAGVRVARGTVLGCPVVAFSTDATAMGGALGADACRSIAQAIDLAVAEQRAVLGIWHSAGARIGEGVAALEGVGEVFAAMVRASGKVPQISLILGPAAGGAAYGPALTDVVITAPAARVFVTGPDVIRSVTGQQVDMETLGGPVPHATKSGLVHVAAPDEASAYARARAITELLSRPGVAEPAAVADRGDPGALLPQRPQRAYDVKPLLHRLVDADGGGPVFEELQARWAPNVVTALGRLAGRSVGVVANNPLRLAGCLDAPAAEKAARFVRMCDALGVPLVVVVDVPGYLPGLSQEWEGIVRRGAKLLHAFAASVVPRVTLVTRKSYGGAYVAMNSRALGATAVFAWPTAQIAVMGAKAAVGVMRRRELAAVPEAERAALHEKLAAEHERQEGGVRQALAIGAVEEVIAPVDTRNRLAEVIAAAPHVRGRLGNIPL